MSNTALQASMVLFLAGDPAWLPSGLTRSVGGGVQGEKDFHGDGYGLRSESCSIQGESVLNLHLA
jgi:hypothetical protein